MTYTITIRNDYHRTECNLRVSAAVHQGGADLSPSQVRLCRRALCGMSDCHCGGDLSERGPQDVTIQSGPDAAIDGATVWTF